MAPKLTTVCLPPVANKEYSEVCFTVTEHQWDSLSSSRTHGNPADGLIKETNAAENNRPSVLMWALWSFCRSLIFEFLSNLLSVKTFSIIVTAERCCQSFLWCSLRCSFIKVLKVSTGHPGWTGLNLRLSCPQFVELLFDIKFNIQISCADKKLT